MKKGLFSHPKNYSFPLYNKNFHVIYVYISAGPLSLAKPSTIMVPFCGRKVSGDCQYFWPSVVYSLYLPFISFLILIKEKVMSLTALYS